MSVYKSPIPDLPASFAPSFWARVKRGSEAECWPWCGARMTKDSYGHCYFRGKRYASHRFAFKLVHGAWAAMQGLIALPEAKGEFGKVQLAECAYAIAAAMLAEKRKREEAP